MQRAARVLSGEERFHWHAKCIYCRLQTRGCTCRCVLCARDRRACTCDGAAYASALAKFVERYPKYLSRVCADSPILREFSRIFIARGHSSLVLDIARGGHPALNVGGCFYWCILCGSTRRLCTKMKDR